MDWMTQLAQYVPQTPQEAADKAALQNDVQKYGTAVLERSSPSGSHICCSGMILDPTMTQVLLVYHNIYQSFSWTGGHADGESDFLVVAFLIYNPMIIYNIPFLTSTFLVLLNTPQSGSLTP